MSRDTTEPTENTWGAEMHPSFGMIRAARVTGDTTLFQSDLRHHHYVIVEISRATRKRDLHSDWVHPGEELIEVAMSEAQWASFVSSMNTSGVPCTLRRVGDDWKVPDAPIAPRLAETAREAGEAAHDAFGDVLAALDAYEAIESTGTPKQKREALSVLRSRLRNAGPNVEFAAQRLTEHSENVVQKARADIEAMVTNKAVQLGLTSAEAAGLLALPVLPTPKAIEEGES